MKILLHICCAPCVIYPLQELAEKGLNSVTGFFYNPNIHPYAEMEKRRRAVADYAKEANFEIIFGEYDAAAFLRNIGGNKEAPSRCLLCWRMRLAETARRAKEKGFEAFTTTLLVSPYQDREAIVKAGTELGAEFGVAFIDSDWRGGFREAQQAAREGGIYRQKYCGCMFSERERFSAKGGR